jgi:hypothetical protein
MSPNEAGLLASPFYVFESVGPAKLMAATSRAAVTFYVQSKTTDRFTTTTCEWAGFSSGKNGYPVQQVAGSYPWPAPLDLAVQ